MNKIFLIGRLTAKPELKITNNETPVCKFTIAVNRRPEGVDFIDCVVWKGQAENLCKYQNKGSLIAIEGTLRKDTYEDKEGKIRSVVQVLANNIEYLESKNAQNNAQISAQNNAQISAQDCANDPFSEFGEQISIDENFLD